MDPDNFEPTPTRPVKPPEHKKAEAEQLQTPESLERPRLVSGRLPEDHLPEGRLPEALADFKRKAEAGEAGEAGSWTIIPLSADDYTTHRKGIEAAFRRFDYEPHKRQITIRMPGAVHERFIDGFKFNLQLKLWKLGVEHQNARIGEFIQQIRGWGSADIELNPNIGKNLDQCTTNAKGFTRSPDAQFSLVNTGLPVVVIEVAYTQQGKKLRGLATDYIFNSRGRVNTVIGFDINQDKDEASTISLGMDHVVRESVFRDKDKMPVNDNLTIYLHDFAHEERCDGVDNLPLTITYSELCNFCDKAETMQLQRKRKSNAAEQESIDYSLPPPSPVEDLSPEEETEDESDEDDPKKAYKPNKDSGEETSPISHVKKRSANRADPNEG
ncbi:hypothetical protein F53441_6885 [Fusarium austroafricanum]|uniref:Uncharacterized protein n=1 Tax=Fusarium austroafricanum TaxID=2364996 RepID=A0A8H4KER8_9HYPO|nr:hypothetical protein F53441_6885 [Fusarium austroafricanum]